MNQAAPTVQRSATIAKELQAVLREDRITIRVDDAEVVHIGLLKEMRQIVLRAVDALPQRLKPKRSRLGAGSLAGMSAS